MVLSAVTFDKPVVGQHTVDVLKELNFSEKDISSLQQSGIIYQAKPTSKL